MKHFHENGIGRFILKQEGISIFGWNKDNYWDKGAGHYQLSYKGLEFELMGKRGNLTMRQGEVELPKMNVKQFSFHEIQSVLFKQFYFYLKVLPCPSPPDMS